ncbi:hypothetical protein OK016_14770 [Vibrio chagasii]|nr:hypothetical protein [Vibrio chagasii]
MVSCTIAEMVQVQTTQWRQKHSLKMPTVFHGQLSLQFSGRYRDSAEGIEERASLISGT